MSEVPSADGTFSRKKLKMNPAVSDPIPARNLFYAVSRFLLYHLERFYFSLEVIGAENLPITGGVLLVSNHASHLDPTTLTCGLHRDVHFLAKEELFRGPLGTFLLKVNALPLRRSGVDRVALRRCYDILREGHVLMMFPEGKRTLTGALQQAMPGAALFAAQTGVPVVPAYIHGTFMAMPVAAKGMQRTKLKVIIGKPFHVDPIDICTLKPKDYYKKTSRLIMSKIGELETASRASKNCG